MAHAGVTPAHLHAIVSALAAPAAASATRRRGGTVRWGGQQFSSPAGIVARANARGANTNVTEWLARHPAAAAIFAGGGTNAAGAAPGPGLPTLPSQPHGRLIPLPNKDRPRTRRRPSPLLQLLGGG